MGRRWSAKEAGVLLRGQPWWGLVASVHERALNILRNDGLLASLVADRRAMTDLSALVPRLFEDPVADLRGRRVGCRIGLLSIDGFGEVDLRGAVAWSGRIRPGIALPNLAASIAAHGRPGGLLGLVDPPRATPWSSSARRALEMRPPDFASLVGLGPGATPSGDDFLAGALFAYRLAGRRPPVGVRRGLTAMLPRTTAAGRTLLWLALRGRFPEFLRELPEAADPLEEARSACSHGETSGTDMLVGCWWATEEIGRASGPGSRG